MAVVAVLAVPAGADATHATAFVPQALRDAATASPNAKFNVIVQGRPSSSAGAVAQNVQSEEQDHQGSEHGVRRQFHSISAVSAQLTGQQVLWLANSADIIAITPDAPLAASIALPPVNVTPPAIAGAAEPGSTLTASPGTWAGIEPMSHGYQWARCNPDCADVPGATGDTYVVQAEDAGHTIAVTVTATDQGGSASAASAPTAAVTAPAPPPPPVVPPGSLAPPLVSGVAAEGDTLTATEGVWSSAGPLTFATQWQRCSAAGDACEDIPGAVGATYALVQPDAGSTLRVVVTATGDTGSASADSAPSAVVAGAPVLPPIVAPTLVTLPALDAAPQEGVQLNVTQGEWAGDGPLAYSYRWQRCTEDCADIAGAETSSYVPEAADVGATLLAVVTAGNEGGSAVAATEQSAPVAGAPSLPPPPLPAPAPPASVTAPTVDAAPQEGVPVAATAGEWSGDAPLTYAFGWERCTADGCTAIAGAESESYVPVADDVGATLRAVVTTSNAAGSAVAESETSAPVAPAAPLPPPPLPAPAAPAVVSPPTAGADAQEGVELVASPGEWSGDAPLSYAYGWERCTADGCAAIAGADALSYLPVADDVGATLRLVVTTTNDAGSTVAVSDPSAAVAPKPPPPPKPPAVLTAPAVADAPHEGVALTASPGEWSGDEPLTHTYRWQRCGADICVDIAGADAASYIPAAGDVGAALRVVVTTTNAAGSAESESAFTVATLPAAPELATAPLVYGATVVGTRLTVTAGTWTSSTPVEHTYQWLRCIGTACAAIAGATSQAYEATVADTGARLRAVVTATNAGGSTTATTAGTQRIAPYSPSGYWSWQVGPYAAHADASWGTAQPPTIAVVDSGVDGSLPGLEGVVSRQVTMTSLAQASRPDGYGHGSFVASVAAGRGPGEAGTAPGARVVSLDVMNDDGMALTSDVIAAADWIYTHKDEEGIRVANFSLLGSAASSIQFDPLDKALEKLWFSGVVVVTAAGNYAVDGASSDVAFAPANDPFAITVGAVDVGGTVPVDDDVSAPWSVWGHTLDGFAKPEIGAPGRYIEAPVPVDSTLYLTRPDRIISPGRMQLSGTSFAAPFVSGIAAELLAAHPAWTPDQVKGALMLGAAATNAATPHSLGVGEVNVAASLALTNPPNPNEALNAFVVADRSGGASPIFDAASWGTAVQANASWGTASWGTASWGTASWGTASWGTAYWSAASWGTASWGTASWGTSVQAVDNAASDVSPAGAYWRWPG